MLATAAPHLARAPHAVGPVAPTPPIVPPAEDWVRTGLVQVDFVDDQPPTKDVVLMAGKQSMRDERDTRALLGDFRALGTGANDNPQAYLDAVRAAQVFSKQLNTGNLWLVDPVVAVLRGRDGWWWGVQVRAGAGNEMVGSSHSRVPTFEDHHGGHIAVTAWQDDVQGLVSGQRYIDTRRDINGDIGSLQMQPIPAAPPVPAPAQANGPATSR